LNFVFFAISIIILLGCLVIIIWKKLWVNFFLLTILYTST
jgi:hypothetical protein